MRTRPVITSLTLVALAGVSFGLSPAAGSQGSITFQATVSGKSHDVGTFSKSESGTDWTSFIGCAIIKQKSAAIFGAYTYGVRTGGVHFAGMKPAGAGVYLSVDHFRPSAATSTYGKLDVSGTFAINGHSYGGAAAFHEPATVKIWDGGRSGTWTVAHADRNYPAKIGTPIHGFAFHATWHCTSVFT